MPIEGAALALAFFTRYQILQILVYFCNILKKYQEEVPFSFP